MGSDPEPLKRSMHWLLSSQRREDQPGEDRLDSEQRDLVPEAERRTCESDYDDQPRAPQRNSLIFG